MSERISITEDLIKGDQNLSDEEKLKKVIKMEGWWKKKNLKKGLLFNIGHQRYFKLLKKGRMLCYWTELPLGKSLKDIKRPHWICFTRNILELYTEYDKKSNHFYIAMPDNIKDLHIKIDDQEQYYQWVRALMFAKEYYKKVPRKSWEIHDDGKDINNIINTVVVAELEKEFGYEAQDRFNYFKDIHKLKKLDKYFERIGLHILANRMAEGTGSVKIFIKDQHNEESSSPTKLGSQTQDINLVENKKQNFVGNKYWLCVTDKDWEFDEDDTILGQDLLPIYLEMNTIYFYPLFGFKDNSGVEEKFATRDLIDVFLNEKSDVEHKYTVRAETLHKIYLFNFERAQDARMWVKCLKKSKKNVEEISRTRSGILSRNVDDIVSKYRFGDLDLIELVKHDLVFCMNAGIDNIGQDVIYRVNKSNLEFHKEAETKNTADVSAKKTRKDVFFEWKETLLKKLDNYDLSTIFSVFRTCTNSMKCTLDCLQAQRPFYKQLFRNYLKEFHLVCVIYMKQIWNRRNKEFDGRQILEFINQVSYQEKAINVYGLKDIRFENSYNELTGTFCTRTYRAVIPMILNVLNMMRKTVTDDVSLKEVSTGPVDLFHICNGVLNLYDWEEGQIPKTILRSMQGLCFHLVTDFQREYILVGTQDDELELRTLIAWTNSNLKFMQKSIEFVQVIAKRSNTDLDEVQSMFSHDIVKKGFADALNKFLLRIQKTIRSLIIGGLQNIRDYKSVDIKSVCDEMKDDLTNIFGLCERTIQTKLWKFVWETFSTNFVLLVVSSTKKYYPKNVPELITKLEGDIELIKQTFSPLVRGKYYDENEKKIQTILDIYKSPSELILVHMLNLEMLLKEEFDRDMLKQILRLRSDVKADVKKDLINTLVEVEKNQRNISAGSHMTLLFKTADSNLKVHQFINKLKDRVYVKKQFMEKEGITGMGGLGQSAIQEVITGKKFEVAINELKGIATDIVFTIINLDTVNQDIKKQFEKQVLGKGANLSWIDRFFWIDENNLYWTKATRDPKNLGNRINDLLGIQNGNDDSDGRIFCISINELQKHEMQTKGHQTSSGAKVEASLDAYIYFRVGMHLYVLSFRTKEKFANWWKAIDFVVKSSKKELQDVVFEEFDAVDEKHKFDELFIRDKIDYSYDNIKFKKMREQKSKKFNFDDELDPELQKHEDKVVQLEDEILESSSEDEFYEEEDVKNGADPNQSKGQTKEVALDKGHDNVSKTTKQTTSTNLDAEPHKETWAEKTDRWAREREEKAKQREIEKIEKAKQKEIEKKKRDEQNKIKAAERKVKAEENSQKFKNFFGFK